VGRIGVLRLSVEKSFWYQGQIKLRACLDYLAVFIMRRSL
jgi:hypothetical protein